MSECPSNELLAHLLAEELGEPERTVVECRVDHCQACQANLARLTSSTIVHQLRPREAPPDDLSSMVLHRLVATGDPLNAMTTLDPAIPGYEILEEIGRGGMGTAFAPAMFD